MLVKLFLTFFKIGMFSFGGGYAMLPFIQEEIIKRHGWLNINEFVDMLAISQITPGPIAINSATFLGYKIAGIKGAFISTLAVITPSFIIILTIAHFIDRFNDSKYTDWIFKGIRPVVIGLIASAAVMVAKDTFVDIKSVIIAIGIFYLIVFKRMSPIVSIIIAGLSGVILY